MTRMANSVPKLLYAAPLSLGGLAERAGVHRNTARAWRDGVLPQPDQRQALVAALREHAEKLLRLAEVVEEEGKRRERQPPRGRRRASA